MAVLRFKYRPPAIQPEMSVAKENASLSLAKKEKPAAADPYGGDLVNKAKREDPIFLATHTQIKRQEFYVHSNEEEYRRTHYPTIHERIELQKDWAKQQLREERFEAEKEAIKFRMDQKIDELNGIETNPDEDLVLEDIEEQLRILQEEDEKEMDNTKKKVSMQDFREQIMEIKERKVIASRNCSMYHLHYSRWDRRKIAAKVCMGYVSRNKDYSEILPWLLLGRREVSSSIQLLLKLGITHILNMTHDIPNLFTQHFVYEKIPIRDNLDADLGRHFDTIISFIDRVERCKGRILVHCSAGASRAPSAVIAYLLAKKRVTLDDAYNYVCRMRSVVYPNKRFLFQLAMLEVKLFESCSVYYHRHWRFYEFNLFRAQQVDERERLGMYSTVMTLYETLEEEEDLLAKKEDDEDNKDD